MRRGARCAAALACLWLVVPGEARPRASVLHARHAQLHDALRHNAFERPLHLVSRETDSGVAGEIVAELATPFDVVRAALADPAQWCEILILHHNTKQCRPGAGTAAQSLDVFVGRKHDQPLEEAQRLAFAFRADAAARGYLRVELAADAGPLGTKDYRIALEAMPDGPARSVLRLSYSYGFGLAGRLAMQAYLATAGRDKVGFTVIGHGPRGQAVHVGGMRGLVERNTMRYHLAIEAVLNVQALPREARFEQSLRDWYTASERHPRQLHEMERGEYLAMKRREHTRR